MVAEATGRLSRDAWTVVGVHALFIAGVGLSTTFVNVYIFRLGGGLHAVARYHAALFLAFALGAVGAGAVASRLDRVVALRIGVALHAVFFLAVLLLGARSYGFVLPLGVVMGLAMAFYYLGASVLMYDFTSGASAPRLVGMVDQARLAGMTLMPFLAGWAIDRLPERLGYPVVFAVSVAFFIGAAVFSGRMAGGREGRPLDLGPVITGRGRPRWRAYLTVQGFRGLRDGVFLFLAAVVVFERTQNEWQLGLYALGTGALTWLVTAWVGARARPERQAALLKVGVAVSVPAALCLVLLPGWTGIIAFGALEAVSLPMVAVPFSAASYALTAEDKGADRVAYMVAREIPLNAGRLVGVGMLLFGLLVLRHPLTVPVVLGALGLANLGALWAFRRGGI